MPVAATRVLPALIVASRGDRPGHREVERERERLCVGEVVEVRVSGDGRDEVGVGELDQEVLDRLGVAAGWSGHPTRLRE